MNENVNKKVLKASGILALIFAGCLILVGILELCVAVMEGNIGFLRAGDRWSADGEPFAVISLYTEEESALSADQISQWAYTMDAKLLESSVTPKENARSWAYCGVTQDTLSVRGPMGDTTAEVMAVTGDFFVFHPLQFTFGSAFLNDNSNPMGVVLDRELAWKLFGAENIVGMTLEIDGEEFTVTGIAERESAGEIYNHTYGERPRMYMNLAGYSKLRENPQITVYEVTLPNPVKGFAKNIFDGVVKVNEETSWVFEVSERFSLLNRYANMKTLKYSWIRENRIEYPYWENEAKVYDYRCAILMIFEVAAAVIGVTTMLLSFILLRVSGYTFTDTVKNTWEKIPKKKKRPIQNKKLQTNAGKKRRSTADNKIE